MLNFKAWTEKYDDRDATCAYQIADQMFIIGGNVDSSSERDNFLLSTSDFIRLPDLPIGFSYGRCESFAGTLGMICSPSQALRNCYLTSDERTFENAGTLTHSHYYG